MTCSQSEASLAELAVSNLASNGQEDLKPSGSAKTMPTLPQFLENIGLPLLTSETLLKLTGQVLINQICLPEASRARTSVSQGKEKASRKAKGPDFGGSMQKPFAYYNRDTHSLRTFQCLLNGALTLSLQTLPKWGMMRNGVCYQLPPSERCIKGREFLFLPTLTASEATMASLLGSADVFYLTKNRTVRKINKNGTNGNAGLTRTLRLLPTRGANEYKGSSKKRFLRSEDFYGAKTSEGLRTSKNDPTYLNPSFAELLMGFPPMWTELSASEIASCLSVRRSLGTGLLNGLKRRESNDNPTTEALSKLIRKITYREPVKKR